LTFLRKYGMFLGKFTQHGYRSPNHQLQPIITAEHGVRFYMILEGGSQNDK